MAFKTDSPFNQTFTRCISMKLQVDDSVSVVLPLYVPFSFSLFPYLQYRIKQVHYAIDNQRNLRSAFVSEKSYQFLFYSVDKPDRVQNIRTCDLYL